MLSPLELIVLAIFFGSIGVALFGVWKKIIGQ